MSVSKMCDPKNLGSCKLPLFSTLCFAIVLVLVIHATSFISNLSLSSVIFVYGTRSRISENRIRYEYGPKVVSISVGEVLLTVKEDVEDNDNHTLLQPSINASAQERIAWFKKVLPKLEILTSTRLSRKFKSRVDEFLANNQCRNQFFMTWISPVSSFGEREIFVIRSLFKAHPKGCLVILSNTLDTAYGYRVLGQLLDKGNKILAVTPDLPFLFKNTAVQSWFEEMMKGKMDPGRVPFPQNLSNLVRLAVLYKYGGVYLDTDFITLKEFSSLRNSIGAQSVDLFGNWTRLNNAVLIFEKSHPVLQKFLEEFASTFDGNKWGHNGPYLVSRVIERISSEKSDFNVTVLPPMAFYPTNWNRIKGLFKMPVNRAHSKWVDAKVKQLTEKSYGVHLWNRQSNGLRIENGSVISKLISSSHYW